MVAVGLLVDQQQSTLARRLASWCRPDDLFGTWSEWGWTATVKQAWDGYACADFYPLIDPAVEYPVDELVSLIGRLGEGTEASATAATELGSLGKPGALAAVQLAKCATNGKIGGVASDARNAAAEALGNLGEHGAAAVPQLTKCREDKSPLVRTAAAEALAQLGDHAASAG